MLQLLCTSQVAQRMAECIADAKMRAEEIRSMPLPPKPTPVAPTAKGIVGLLFLCVNTVTAAPLSSSSSRLHAGRNPAKPAAVPAKKPAAPGIDALALHSTTMLILM